MMRFVKLLSIILFIASCSEEDQIMRIAVSSNMQWTAEELVKAFSEKKCISCEPVISSSGKLTAQIMDGAPFDLFLSADTSYPCFIHDQGYSSKEPQIYAYGSLALWSGSELEGPVEKVLAGSKGKIAIASPGTAPYGRAAEEWFIKTGLYYSCEQRMVYGESVSQLNHFISSGSVAYAVTAASMKGRVGNRGYWVDLDKDLLIAQSAVILSRGEKRPECEEFMAFLLSKEGQAILKKNGYVAIHEQDFRDH